MRRWIFWLGFFGMLVCLAAAPEAQQARTRLADGFDQPVGKPDGEGYYKSRGFASYHPGEDWNGLGGGNSDLGAPVYAIGHGYVVFARDARMGWGNVVLIRHVFLEKGELQMVDSMYAHLSRILVREGQQVTRGQQVGTIGTNRGMYVAHLHFEIRKNLAIGINRSAFPRDFANYYRPSTFIEPRRKLPGLGRSAMIPINTYKLGTLTSAPSDETTEKKSGSPQKSPTPKPSNDRKSPFRVNRFDDL